MKFGEVKCAVMRVEKGKVINSDTPLKINNFKIKSTKKSTNILVRTKTSPTVVQLIKKKFHLNTSREYVKYGNLNSQHLSKSLITLLPYLC